MALKGSNGSFMKGLSDIIFTVHTSNYSLKSYSVLVVTLRAKVVPLRVSSKYLCLSLLMNKLLTCLLTYPRKVAFDEWSGSTCGPRRSG